MLSQICTVLLDMDEVIADFTTSALEVHGFTREAFERRRPPGCWDMCDSLQISEEAFWRPITALGEQFWVNIDPLPWLSPLVNLLLPYNWYVVTSPARCPTCWSGKVKWLKNYLGARFNRYVLTNYKQLLANPQTLLIDDSERNLQKFRSAGGRTLLFPSHGNQLHTLATDPLPFIQENLNALHVQKCQ